MLHWWGSSLTPARLVPLASGTRTAPNFLKATSAGASSNLTPLRAGSLSINGTLTRTSWNFGVSSQQPRVYLDGSTRTTNTWRSSSGTLVDLPTVLDVSTWTT